MYSVEWAWLLVPMKIILWRQAFCENLIPLVFFTTTMHALIKWFVCNNKYRCKNVKIKRVLLLFRILCSRTVWPGLQELFENVRRWPLHYCGISCTCSIAQYQFGEKIQGTCSHIDWCQLCMIVCTCSVAKILEDLGGKYMVF